MASEGVLPDKNLQVIVRQDETTFGILSSSIHEVWALRQGSSLEDRPRYTATSTFETFPFPAGLTPDASEDQYAHDPRSQRIAAAASRLLALRESWLDPSELIERVAEVMPGYPDRVVPKNEGAGRELQKRTLTNLYNSKPAWLQHAQRELDEAVGAAYGWGWPLADEEILKKLFELNQERFAQGNDRGGLAVGVKAARKKRSPGAH